MFGPMKPKKAIILPSEEELTKLYWDEKKTLN